MRKSDSVISRSVFRSAQERAHLLSRTLGWLTTNLSLFDPPQEDEVFDLAPEQILPDRSRKAFGELGLALFLAHRSPQLRGRAEIRLLTEAWLAMGKRRRIFFEARRRLHLVPLMAVALAVLTELDTAPDSSRQALQDVFDRQYMDRTERSAAAQVDIRFYLDVAGIAHAFPAMKTLFERSTLLALPSLRDVQRMDLYAITHLIFHLSDFGVGELPVGPPSQILQIEEYLALALSMCLAEQDYDLAAEFLISRICFGIRPDSLSYVASDALLRAQRPSGFIPDLSWLRGLKETADPQEAVKEEFFAVYHPTLVVLILLTCDIMREPHENGVVA